MNNSVIPPSTIKDWRAEALANYNKLFSYYLYNECWWEYSLMPKPGAPAWVEDMDNLDDDNWAMGCQFDDDMLDAWDAEDEVEFKMKMQGLLQDENLA